MESVCFKEGEKVDVITVEPEQHFTSAPPRYSEASLIKRLEELGIGRPSTYATIMRTLQVHLIATPAPIFIISSLFYFKKESILVIRLPMPMPIPQQFGGGEICSVSGKVMILLN